MYGVRQAGLLLATLLLGMAIASLGKGIVVVIISVLLLVWFMVYDEVSYKNKVGKY